MDLTSFGGVSLSFGYNATYSGGFMGPIPKYATINFDDDIAFDTTGIVQCPYASISNQTRSAALAACPASVVGGGAGQYNNGGQLTSLLDAFNGQPSGGYPVILLHIAIFNGTSEAVDYTSMGAMTPSSRGGDFGTQIQFNFADTPGIAQTQFAVTLNNLEPAPGIHFVSARCSDLDRVLNFATDFTYYDASTRSTTATQSCPPTGQRAAALKKCKKIQPKKARKKCRKKAKQLPV